MPFGFTEWESGKAEMTAILQDQAQNRAMISYSDLSRRLRSIQIGHRDPAMACMLGEISMTEYSEGRGMLSVIVVHKVGDQEPGAGFYDCAESLGLDISDRMRLWVSQLHKVHGYWANRGG